MTEYIILRNDGDGTLWHADGHLVKASSARRALASADLAAGEYVAIPTRSWKALTVKVEQTTKITIG